MLISWPRCAQQRSSAAHSYSFGSSDSTTNLATPGLASSTRKTTPPRSGSRSPKQKNCQSSLVSSGGKLNKTVRAPLRMDQGTREPEIAQKTYLFRSMMPTSMIKNGQVHPGVTVMVLLIPPSDPLNVLEKL